ncbi:molybdopterin molybdenumtransferase MoeA [Actinomycetes bacterium]|nr:molybdopterin molybdenumtransferase MoeA [Actinomycetes bacterium]
MLSVEDYRAQVLAGVKALAPIEMPLLDAHGCVLATEVSAPWPLPSFDNSSMDGYAVVAADLAGATGEHPVQLTVVDDVPAGFRATEVVVQGVAIRIMTGAPMPEGADAVVPVEKTDGGTDLVQINEPVSSGANIRLAGEDVLLGEVVMRPGTYLTSRQLSLLASVGKGSVLVHPKPRVVVISTGSELVEPGTQLRKGLITDSNSFLLVAAAQEAGAVAFRVPPVIDDEGVFMSTLEDQLHFADLIVTSGGVSMGAYDTVKAVLSKLGTVTFTKVAMNPGMPQGHGRIGPNGTPIITLPGNPVSAYVSFETFVRPVIRTMQGHQEIYRPYVQAICEVELASPPAKRQFVRAKFGGAQKATVAPVRGQGSHAVGGLSQADCFIVIPAGQASVAAGATVDVIDLRNW